MQTSPGDSWLNRVVAGTIGDVKFAARRLWKDRGFTAVALVTLAFCIGANTAIFSMVYALVLKPLPFPSPDRLVEVYNSFPKVGFNKFPSNLVQYSDFKAHTTCFEAIAVWEQNTLTVGEAGSLDRVHAADCTAEMFDVLGIRPVIGQFFTLKNSQQGEDKVIVLSESFWKSQFNADPGVLGRPLRVEGEVCRIVGVAPKAMEAFNARARFFRPISWRPEDIVPQARYSCSRDIFARLKPGESPTSALGQVVALERSVYDHADPGLKGFLDQSGHTMGLGRIQAERVQPIKSSLYLLQGGVIFVLLIGCVNVANLLLTRANGQQSELAIRAALGAGRTALARQLLIESLLLTLAGAALGVGLAYAAVQVIDQYTARLLPDMLPAAIDADVLGCAAAVSIVVGVGIGLFPVVHLLRSNLAALINQSSRGSSGSRGVRAISGLLVSGQVAVALMLLSGAGLLIHSFANALAVNPGFDPPNLTVGSIALPSSYQAKERAAPFQDSLTRAMREIPGIDGSALATGIPFEGGLPIMTLTLKDSTLPRDSAQPGAFLVGVSLDYFKTLRLQLLNGRFMEDADLKRPGGVFVVDERFQQKYFPGHSAVGGHFTFGNPPATDSEWPEIVGVVRNVPHNGVEDRSGNPFVYYPIQATTPGGMSLFVRSARPVGDLVSALREKLHSIDPAIPLFDTNTMERVIGDSFANRRAVMVLLGGFAALALFLSAVGIYGVLAYDISQRTREIGIRGAIGASRAQIVGLIVRQGLWKSGVGLAVGLLGAILLSRSMVSLLFELKPTDPWAYLFVSLLLAAVAFGASYLPARRAAKINPIEALRNE